MAMTLLRWIDRNGERVLLLVFYTMIVMVIGVEVMRRFLLSYSSLWGEEVARYCLIYLIWVGASHAVRTRTHIRIDIVFELLPKRHHVWLFVFGEVATIIFAAFAFYLSMNPILTSLQYGAVTEGLRISRAFALVAVPLGFLMTEFRLVQNLIRDLSDHFAGREVYAGKKLFE